MNWILWTLLGVGLFIVAAVVYFFLAWKKQYRPHHLTFRDLAVAAKEALLDKEHLPEIYRRLKNRVEEPFDPLQENKKRAEIPGTYHFRWPRLQVGYTNKDSGEKIVIQKEGHPEVVTAFFTEGAVNGIKIGDTNLDMEDFEMRHAGTISDQLRSFVRYHLRFPGGTLEIEKAPEPTFKPVLDLRKAGEIKLHGKPPPGKMPNFDNGED
ncbi:MAG TPA: hypothetical protein PLN21_18730 [Gemmatales bacterium]|nr:hypothetical protein [Gemmatales bacterium]